MDTQELISQCASVLKRPGCWLYCQRGSNHSFQLNALVLDTFLKNKIKHIFNHPIQTTANLRTYQKWSISQTLVLLHAGVFFWSFSLLIKFHHMHINTCKYISVNFNRCAVSVLCWGSVTHCKRECLPLGLNAIQDMGLSWAGKWATTPSPSESSLTSTYRYTQKHHNIKDSKLKKTKTKRLDIIGTTFSNLFSYKIVWKKDVKSYALRQTAFSWPNISVYNLTAFTLTPRKSTLQCTIQSCVLTKART